MTEAFFVNLNELKLENNSSKNSSNTKSKKYIKKIKN